MKKVLLLLLITFQNLPAIIAQIKTTFPTQESIKNQMDEAMKTNDLPAVVAIAINGKNQKRKYTFGKAVWTEDAKITSQHIFEIHSMTKLVTSIAAMQLVEKGLIGLDDDLSNLLPEMAKIPILSNGQLLQAKNPITLRHLLTHTSGFGYKGSTYKDLTDLKDYKLNYKDDPRRFESGTQFLYGTSTNWAGKLVEKITKMDLETYFRKNITGPLGMNRTWYNLPDSLKQFVVSNGNRGFDGKQTLKESKNRIPTKLVTDFEGDGGLYSSPDDYTILLQCMLNYGTINKVLILKKATILEMNKNQIGDMVMTKEEAYHNPFFCCNFEGLITNKTKWSLYGLIDNEDKPYGRKAGAVSWGGLLNTFFYIDFKSGIAASIYTQHLPFNHPATTVLFDKFSEIIYSGK